MRLIDEVRTELRVPNPKVARAIRKAAGVSQARMARELSVGRVTVARWETGARHPRGEFLRAYVLLLDELLEVAS